MDIQQSEAHRRSENAETVARFSNITCLTGQDAPKIAPLFIARAGRDEVPTMDDPIDRFVADALAKNVPLTVMNHPEGPHGFDNRKNDDRSREIIRAALTFMKLHLAAHSGPTD
jgi:dienelactone hydrolase